MFNKTTYSWGKKTYFGRNTLNTDKIRSPCASVPKLPKTSILGFLKTQLGDFPCERAREATNSQQASGRHSKTTNEENVFKATTLCVTHKLQSPGPPPAPGCSLTHLRRACLSAAEQPLSLKKENICFKVFSGTSTRMIITVTIY